MFCKIVKITNRFGEDKLYDPHAVQRIGRIIDDVQSTISVGGIGMLYCVFPSHGKDMVTSRIVSITNEGKLTIVETKNSIYYLAKVEELE